MKIAIVDDASIYRNALETLCGEFSSARNCRLETISFSSGAAFLEACRSTAFSLVFMDIYIENENGVEIATKMRAFNRDCLLVFFTSSTDFMPEAFACHAFEYITKPFSRQRVFEVLSEAWYSLEPDPRHIEITSNRVKVPILLCDILSVLTDLHYLLITLIDGNTLRCRMTISEFLTQAEDDPRFILVNKGVLLNIEHIKELANSCCVLTNGEQFSIRVRDRSKIEQKIQNYNFTAIRSRQRQGGSQS
jgi:DNA-binding LytR/AlgR family response regulator